MTVKRTWVLSATINAITTDHHHFNNTFIITVEYRKN